MKIILLGYGKMGRIIEELAVAAGDEIVLTVDHHNRSIITAADLAGGDVAIEFSRPEAAVGNIDLCLAAGVPIVVGTTGWLNELSAVTKRIGEADGALFWASNFSIGVNVYFAAAQRAAELVGKYGGYTPSVREIHHLQKLDSPSGTAITLAETVAGELEEYNSWVLDEVISPAPQSRIAPATAPEKGKLPLPIISVREQGVPGTHVLTLKSEVDTLELTHTAHSRKGFASGALTAARWLVGRRGTFTMKDMLG